MGNYESEETIINSLLIYLPETSQLLSSLIELLNETNSTEETSLSSLKTLIISQEELLQNISELGQIASDISNTETNIESDLMTSYKALLFKLLIGIQFLNDWISIEIDRISNRNKRSVSIEESQIVLSKSIDSFYESAEFALRVVNLLTDEKFLEK